MSQHVRGGTEEGVASLNVTAVCKGAEQNIAIKQRRVQIGLLVSLPHNNSLEPPPPLILHVLSPSLNTGSAPG